MDKRLGYHADTRHHSTPEHDEMCMFIHDNYEIIVHLVLENLGWSGTLNNRSFSLRKPRFEQPVKFQKNNYNKEEVLGYIDVASGVWIDNAGTFEDFKNGELFRKWHYDSEDQKAFKPINFEIKPKIDSIGDVIRQIQYYKSYDNIPYATQWVVITKTKGFNKYFESQDIILFDYDWLKNKVVQVKEEMRKEEERKIREEEKRLAEEARLARERKEKMDRFKAKAKGFVRGMFGLRVKENATDKPYNCIQCGRAINHKGRCWPCNTKNKRK